MLPLIFRHPVWISLTFILTCCVAPSGTKTVASGKVKDPGVKINIPWTFHLSKNRPLQLWIDVKDQNNNLLPGDLNVKVTNHSNTAVSFDKVKRLVDGGKFVEVTTINPGSSAVVYSGPTIYGCVTSVHGDSGWRELEFEILPSKKLTGLFSYKITADWGDGP